MKAAFNLRGKHFEHQISRLACCTSAVVDTSTQTLVYTTLAECLHKTSIAGVIQHSSVAVL